jgi:hypothetical protein
MSALSAACCVQRMTMGCVALGSCQCSLCCFNINAQRAMLRLSWQDTHSNMLGARVIRRAVNCLRSAQVTDGSVPPILQ